MSRTPHGTAMPSSGRVRRRGRVLIPALTCAVTASGLLLSGVTGARAASPVVNGGFEAGTTGWFSSAGSSLSLVSGHSGSNAARVANGSGSVKAVALNDSVNTVGSTRKGQTYTASTWLRLTKTGTKVGIRLMEYKNSSLYGQRQTQIDLSDTAWHSVSVTYTAATDGASLDLNVLGWALPSGVALDVDDVNLVLPTAPASTPPQPAPAPAPAPPTAPSGWRQVWNDEFNDSSVDTSKWRVRNNQHSPNEISCLTSRSSNVSESGGSLHIKAQRENYTCAGYSSSWTSGYLDTIGKMSQTYGRFEMRAKMPTQANTSKGMWPAFWLRPDDGGNGEIDIMEAVGSAAGEKNYNRFSQTLWYDYKNTYPRQANSYTFTGPTMSDAFHTYAVGARCHPVVRGRCKYLHP